MIAVLGGASYFQASTVTDLATRDDLAFVTLPVYSPEFDPETGEVSDEYATDTSGTERCETASTAAETAPNDPELPSNPDRSESSQVRPLEEARAIAGPEDEPDHEDTENGSGNDDSATEFDLI